MTDAELKAKVMEVPELHSARHWLTVPSFRMLGLQTIAGWLNEHSFAQSASVDDAERIVSAG